MKNILTSALFFASTLLAVAQNQDKAIVRVKYDFAHMRDTTKTQNLYKETMLLVAGKNASAFLSYDKILRDLAAKAAFEEQIREQGGQLKSIKSPQATRTYTATEYYYYADDNKLFTIENMGVNYIVEENPEKINWKIEKDTQVIEGINCKKATALFKGRNWTAWFAEELPFASGPWKLNGLPGLIIQAYDDKKEVAFDFAGLEKVAENLPNTKQDKTDEYTLKDFGKSGFLTSTEIKIPSNVVKATVKEMQRLKETRENDPQGFAKSQMAALGMGGLTKVASGTGPSPSFRNSITALNNPIEKIK
jgi:GLPGLI family protein